MTIGDRLRAFFFRKRRWQWVLVGVAIVAVGQYLDAHKVEPKSAAEAGVRLTERLHQRLASVQPQTIADLYGRAGAGRHGIGFCGPTAATGPLRLKPTHLKRRVAPASVPWIERAHLAPVTPLDGAMAPLERVAGLPTPRPTIDLAEILRREAIEHPARAGDKSALLTGLSESRAPIGLPEVPAPTAKASWDCARGWLGIADSAALTLRVTPEVGYAVWAEGGWSTTILFALTLLAMTVLLMTLWGDSEKMGCAVFPVTLVILATGPVATGFVFWGMLWLLLGLTLALGKVFAGLAIVLAWIATGWKLAMLGVEALSRGDDAKENLETLQASLGRSPPPPLA